MREYLFISKLHKYFVEERILLGNKKYFLTEIPDDFSEELHSAKSILSRVYVHIISMAGKDCRIKFKHNIEAKVHIRDIEDIKISGMAYYHYADIVDFGVNTYALARGNMYIVEGPPSISYAVDIVAIPIDVNGKTHNDLGVEISQALAGNENYQKSLIVAYYDGTFRASSSSECFEKVSGFIENRIPEYAIVSAKRDNEFIAGIDKILYKRNLEDDLEEFVHKLLSLLI